MQNCPICQTSIDEDFGVTNCPNCSAALIIEMDGSVKVYEQESSEMQQQESVVVDNFNSESSEEEIDVFTQQNEEVLDQVNDSYNEENDVEEYAELDETAFEDSGIEQSSLSEDSVVVDFASNDLSEIESFANTSSAQSFGSPFMYNIILKGIDSIEIRTQLKTVLSDNKFLWDFEKILEKIDNGNLVIKEVTPVKAHMLISKIKNLALEITWEQYEIHS